MKEYIIYCEGAETLEKKHPEKLRIPHPWKHSTLGWTKLWEPNVVEDVPGRDRGIGTR